jgi:hypothetical protein
LNTLFTNGIYDSSFSIGLGVAQNCGECPEGNNDCQDGEDVGKRVSPGRLGAILVFGYRHGFALF